jgi:hypothetical protein
MVSIIGTCIERIREEEEEGDFGEAPENGRKGN